MKSVLRLLACCILFPFLGVAAASAQGYAPNGIGGITITVIIQGGDGLQSTSGAYLFQTKGNNYTITPLTGNIAASFGTCVYTRIAGDTATLACDDTVLGSSFTFNLSFDTPSSAQWIVDNESGEQTGIFEMSYPRSTPNLAPGLLSEGAIVGLISSATGTFASSGAFDYQFLSGTSFREVFFEGTFGEFPGSYTYARQSTKQATLTVSNEILPTGATYQLTFTGGDNGSFTATASDGSTQSGSFYLCEWTALDQFDATVDYTGSWYQSWLGPIYLGYFNISYGFIYSSEQGFQYATGTTSPNAIFFYDSQLGWLFSGESTYPYYYSFSQGAWLYYLQGGTPALRYFYAFPPGNGWFSVSE